MDQAIGRLLGRGVLVSGGLLCLGWVLSAQYSADPFVRFQSYERIPLRSLLQSAVSQGQWGLLLCYIGLFVLVALPSLRVALTMVLFLRQKQPIFASIAAFVLVVLIASFYFGIQL